MVLLLFIMMMMIHERCTIALPHAWHTSYSSCACGTRNCGTIVIIWKQGATTIANNNVLRRAYNNYWLLLIIYCVMISSSFACVFGFRHHRERANESGHCSAGSRGLNFQFSLNNVRSTLLVLLVSSAYNNTSNMHQKCLL